MKEKQELRIPTNAELPRPSYTDLGGGLEIDNNACAAETEVVTRGTACLSTSRFIRRECVDANPGGVLLG